jgi:hypothetical protein
MHMAGLFCTPPLGYGMDFCGPLVCYSSFVYLGTAGEADLKRADTITNLQKIWV